MQLTTSTSNTFGPAVGSYGGAHTRKIVGVLSRTLLAYLGSDVSSPIGGTVKTPPAHDRIIMLKLFELTYQLWRKVSCCYPDPMLMYNAYMTTALGIDLGRAI